MGFDMKNSVEPLLVGFPKLEEDLRALEPLRIMSWILVVVDKVKLSHLDLLILSSWDFPLRCGSSSLLYGPLTPYPFL